jgi:hypothetical protein
MKSSTWFALFFTAFLFVSNQSQAQITTFPLSGLDGTVTATLWSGKDLIIGGSFVWVDGSVRLNRIGRWDGTTFHAYGEGFNGSVNALTVLENGTLVAAWRL